MKDSPTHTPYNGRNNDVLQLFQTGAGTISYVQAKGGEDVVGWEKYGIFHSLDL